MYELCENLAVINLRTYLYSIDSTSVIAYECNVTFLANKSSKSILLHSLLLTSVDQSVVLKLRGGSSPCEGNLTVPLMKILLYSEHTS